MNTPYVPGTMLEARNVVLNKADEVPGLAVFVFYLKRTDNKQRNQQINTVLQRNKTMMSYFRLCDHKSF